MRNLTQNFILIVIVLMIAKVSTLAQEVNEEKNIKNVVALYESALNNSSIEEITQLFLEDGVLILQGTPTQIGIQEIEGFYASLFTNLSFSLKFNVDEVVQLSKEWAFIRTTTSGTVNIIANNSSNPSNGHELFILKRQSDGRWRIARYAGSSS